MFFRSKLKLLRRFSEKTTQTFDKVRLINSHSTNIHENLALESFIFRECELEYPTMLVWRNSKTIVIGKHQNPFKECYMNRINQDGIILARRKSGGGAVYHDLGNSIFSFLTPVFDPNLGPFDTKKDNNEVILDALSTLGIQGEISGRNDLELEGRKFSGSAYEIDLGGKYKRKKALHHGTLLLDVNFQDLWKYLNPNKKKLESKGVDSVISRVVNLCEVVPDLDHLKIQQALFEAFKRRFAGCEFIEEEVHSPLEVDPKVKEIYDGLTSKDWVLGETPDFTYNLEKKFDWGLIDVFVKVRKGKIIGGKVFSDCLVPEVIDWMNYEIDSKAHEYSVEGVDFFCEIVKGRFFGDEAAQGMVDDVKGWWLEEI